MTTTSAAKQPTAASSARTISRPEFDIARGHFAASIQANSTLPVGQRIAHATTAALTSISAPSSDQARRSVMAAMQRNREQPLRLRIALSLTEALASINIEITEE